MLARAIAILIIGGVLVWLLTLPRERNTPETVPEAKLEVVPKADVTVAPKATRVPRSEAEVAPKSEAVVATEIDSEPVVSVRGRALPPPRDEKGRDKTLAAFFVQLKDVLKRKDRNALLAMLAPNIDIGRTDMSGPAAFYTAWGLSDDTSVFGVISQILSLNGVWVGEQFCGPYVNVQFPDDLDRSKHTVVLNPDVKLRASQSATGKVVATLAYEIVEVLERGPEWTKVRTTSGAEGYVPIAYLYSPAGYHACFSKNAEGAWQIQSLAVGR